MSTLEHNYAAAVLALEARGTKSDAIVRGLSQTLARRGHQKLLPRIVRAIGMDAERVARRTGTTLTVAKDADATRYAADIKEAAERMGAGSAHETVVDERLVGGFALRTADALYDRSYRTALVDLYRRMTR